MRQRQSHGVQAQKCRSVKANDTLLQVIQIGAPSSTIVSISNSKPHAAKVDSSIPARIATLRQGSRHPRRLLPKPAPQILRRIPNLLSKSRNINIQNRPIHPIRLSRRQVAHTRVPTHNKVYQHPLEVFRGVRIYWSSLI